MTLTELEAFNHALELAENGKREEAHSILVQLRRSNPDNSRVLLCYAYTANDVAEAREALEWASVLDPRNSSVSFAKIWLTHREKVLDQANPTTVLSNGKKPPSPFKNTTPTYSVVVDKIPSATIQATHPQHNTSPVEWPHADGSASLDVLDETVVEPKAQPAPVLRHNRSFWLLLLGQAVSVLGDQCWFVAMPWLVLELTGSAVDTGLTRALEWLPYILFALVAGVLIDRWNRRRLLIGIEIGRALCLLTIPALAWLGVLQVWQLFVIAFVLSSLDVFFNVGLPAVVPGIVSKELLTQANSLMESAFSLTAIIGLPLMGGLVAIIGAPAVLAFDGFSFVFSLVVLLILRFPPPPATAKTLSRRQFWSDIGEGLGFIWRERVMRSIASLNFLNNLTNASLLILSVYYLKEVLNLPGEVYGLVLSSAAFGTFLGALFNVRLVRRVGHGNAVVLGLVLGIAPFLVYSLTSQWLLLALGHFFFGMALIYININTNVIRQTVVDPEMLGRVIGSARMLAYTSLPLGCILAGWFAEWWGVIPVIYLALAIRVVLIGLAYFSPLRGYKLNTKR